MGLYLYPIPTHEPRRLLRLRFSVEILIDILRGYDGRTLIETTTPIPDDAHVVGVDVEQGSNVINLFVESETFPLVTEGSFPSDWDISMRSVFLSDEIVESIRILKAGH